MTERPDAHLRDFNVRQDLLTTAKFNLGWRPAKGKSRSWMFHNERKLAEKHGVDPERVVRLKHTLTREEVEKLWREHYMGLESPEPRSFAWLRGPISATIRTQIKQAISADMSSGKWHDEFSVRGVASRYGAPFHVVEKIARAVAKDLEKKGARRKPGFKAVDGKWKDATA